MNVWTKETSGNIVGNIKRKICSHKEDDNCHPPMTHKLTKSSHNSQLYMDLFSCEVIVITARGKKHVMEVCWGRISDHNTEMKTDL